MLDEETGVGSLVLKLENDFSDKSEPVLGAAYDELQRAFMARRSREVAMHLVFIAWYIVIEPNHITGADSMRHSHAALLPTLDECADYLLGSIRNCDDTEALFVVWVLANQAPYVFGDAETWSQRVKDVFARLKEICPAGIPPQAFRGRGFFGEYFEGMAELSYGNLVP